MLRRKLLIRLAPLVALLLLVAIIAIWLLQGVLGEIRRIDGQSGVQPGSWLGWFRWLIFGLSLVFLLVINFSVIVLLRTSAMVLRPVDKLLEATRQLRAEHFDYRVNLDNHDDEFDTLARAYNSLAEQLQSNERKRIETLGQVAITMNHELNNAIATIDLQLAMLSRQRNGEGPASEKCLRQIQQSLQRMTQTIQSLKNVRRIVLTEYSPGTKMLDLQRSVEEDEGEELAAHPTAAGAEKV
jgi:signal transduction histidine kinase